ncbi:MAG: RCC1 domain-containing protein [Candidatus Brocadiaceae bacterium]|nr:RCC1 domain-containing protein [Candidatus Brocadiaceae bacterium]
MLTHINGFLRLCNPQVNLFPDRLFFFRYHTIAIHSDGTVWAWGHNGYGQLGNKANMDCNTSVKVKSLFKELSYITDISSGSFHSVALKSDGTVYS